VTRAELRDRWEQRKVVLAECGDIRTVRVITLFLADLEDLARDEDDRLLTLKQAADRSGYNAEYLGRLLREGKLQNAGRKGAPRVRLGDLPRRPMNGFAETERKLYDAGADARSLLSRLGER